MKRKKIVLVAERKDELYSWMSIMLKKKFDIEEIYLHSDVFNAPFFLKRVYLVIKKWRTILRKFNPHKVILYGKAMTSIWIIVPLIKILNPEIEIILFRYDIEYLRPFPRKIGPKLGHFITRKLEKYCFINSGKLLHKGLENELEFLPFYKKIKDKPHYWFREFLDPNLIKKYRPKTKLSKKDGEFHLVTHGNLPMENLSYSDSIWEFYPKFTKQQIHIHIYIKVDKDVEKKLKKIECENTYFHYEGYLEREQLLSELARFDYGLYLSSWNRGNIKNNYAVTTAIGYRIFDYISARLPIIASDDSTAVVELLDKSGIGLHISYQNIFSLKKILRKEGKGYVKKIRNIDKVIDNFVDSTRLLKFIDLDLFK